MDKAVKHNGHIDIAVVSNVAVEPVEHENRLAEISQTSNPW